MASLPPVALETASLHSAPSFLRASVSSSLGAPSSFLRCFSWGLKGHPLHPEMGRWGTPHLTALQTGGWGSGLSRWKGGASTSYPSTPRLSGAPVIF